MRTIVGSAALLAARLAWASSSIAPEKASEILSLKNRGLAQLEEGKSDAARDSFLKLAPMVPAEPLPFADAAVAALRENDLASAQTYLARARQNAPASAAVLMISAAIENARNRPAQLRSELARAAALSPGELEARWRWIRSAEMELATPELSAGKGKYLREILAASPSNIPALLKLLLAEIDSGESVLARDVASHAEKILAPMDSKLAKFFDEGRENLRAGNLKQAGLKFRIAENLLRVTDRYRQSLSELYTDVVGLPMENFSADFEETLRPGAGAPIEVSFSEVRAPGSLSPESLLHRVDLGNTGEASVYRIPPPFRGALFLDFDLDGDLDVYLYGGIGADRLMRNNGDDTWTDVTAATGEPDVALTRAVVTDFDRDGDPDIIGIDRDGELVWRSNLRQGRFQTMRLGVSDALDVAAGDIDADGLPDLVVATKSGIVLLINRGGGSYEKVTGGDLARLPAGFVVRRVALADLDNDGFPDVIAGGESGIAIYRNAGFHNFTSWPIAPRGVGRVDELVPYDADGDGDLDLLLSVDGRVRLFENEGGNRNNWLDVVLQGLSTGSGKVNRQGVGSIVEVKAGALYVAQTAGVMPSHFGLGRRQKADVVRCVWTNGVPQNLIDQKTRTVITEIQQLKGSCPFVYARDGRTGKWNFISDALGRSPIGLLYDGVHLAGWDSREWLKIPGEKLSPAPDGTVALDYTEELWEAAYLDMVNLLAVDHPAGTDFVPNERMVPGVLEKKIFTVASPRPIRSARANGRDVTELLAAEDHRYVEPGHPTAYQGIRTEHDLVLDLGPVSAGDRVMLYLNGWIFYTDTSINVSLSQRGDLRGLPPQLETPDGNGGWKTVIESLGFPAGKSKTMPVDLTGIVRPEDPRVRIRTNLEIYWDHIYTTVNDPAVPVKMMQITPANANLYFRGFSRRYRETPDGPELFDHDDLDRTPHWADVSGRLTSYGDVTELLQNADDRWVAFEGGDAIRVEFDARSLPRIPAGWRRDYILVSDGWDKDFDKNTVTGTTIGPYPFHAMTNYPYSEKEKFPDPQFLEQTLTRTSSSDRFWSVVRDWGGPPLQ